MNTFILLMPFLITLKEATHPTSRWRLTDRPTRGWQHCCSGWATPSAWTNGTIGLNAGQRRRLTQTAMQHRRLAQSLAGEVCENADQRQPGYRAVCINANSYASSGPHWEQDDVLASFLGRQVIIWRPSGSGPDWELDDGLVSFLGRQIGHHPAVLGVCSRITLQAQDDGLQSSGVVQAQTENWMMAWRLGKADGTSSECSRLMLQAQDDGLMSYKGTTLGRSWLLAVVPESRCKLKMMA